MRNWVIGLLALGTALFTGEFTQASTKDYKVAIAPQSSQEKEYLKGEANHPFLTSEEGLKRALSSLGYKKMGLMTWSKGKRIFEKEQVEKGASLIQKALSQVKKEEKVTFSFPGRKGSTEGEVFVLKGRLAINFIKIDGKGHLDPFDYRNDSSAKKIYNWEILLGEDQKFYRVKKLFGISGSKITMVVLSTAIGEKKETEPLKREEVADREKGFDRERLNEKLEFLKEMKDKGLIGEEDYRAKIKEIMDRI